MLRTVLSVAVVALALLSGASARAGTANATIAVSVTVVSTCSVSGSAVSFGAVAAGSGAQQQSALTVKCNPGTAYVVALNEGQSGDASKRIMSGGDGGELSYDLYRDAARSQRWADGAMAVSGIGTGDVQSLPLYAAIQPSAASTAGNYSDSVTATLTY